MTNNQLLVFPTSRAIREYIEKQKGVNDLIPKTITIDELFKNTLFFSSWSLLLLTTFLRYINLLPILLWEII